VSYLLIQKKDEVGWKIPTLDSQESDLVFPSQKPSLQPYHHHLILGEIVTSIKMNVGQDSRQSQSKNIPIPPPVDVSNTAAIRTVTDLPQPPKAIPLMPDVIGNPNAGKIITSQSDDPQTESKPFVVQTNPRSRESSLKKSPSNVLSNPAEFTDLQVIFKVTMLKRINDILIPIYFPGFSS